jgi:predicted nucleic acid-binding protein
VTETTFRFPGPQRIVVSDANVLYSRVLRDYLLYASSQEIITIVWSTEILSEATEHMMENISGFDQAAADHLVAALDKAYPASTIDPEPTDFQRLEKFNLPDEDDRHVIATALAAEADTICTDDKIGFPSEVLDVFGIEAITSDMLICQLIERYPQAMLITHHAAVRSLRGATDGSTIKALERAGAPQSAMLIARLLHLNIS